MKLSRFCFLVLFSFTACSQSELAEKPVDLESKHLVIPHWKLPGVEVEHDRYWFCSDIDTAFQHPLSIEVLNLSDSIGPNQAKQLIDGLPKLKNLNSLWFSGHRNLNLEPFFEVLQSLNNLHELQIDSYNFSLLGKIRKLKQLKNLTLKQIPFREVPIDFLNGMTLKSLTIVGGDKGFNFSGRLSPNNPLEELTISRNNDKELNYQIYKLNNLQLLSIEFSSTSSINPAIASLLKLKKLQICLSPISKDEAKIAMLRQLLKGKCDVLTERDLPLPPY